MKKNCRYLIGYRPCIYHKSDGSTCENCTHYDKFDKKILIINFDGIGDVLRTMAMLKSIKEKYPNCHITFFTSRICARLISDVDEIDKVLNRGLYHSMRLMVEEYDVLINFDKGDDALALSTMVKAKEKFGIGMDKSGHMFPFNKEAQILIDVGLSDKIKGENKLTMQELMFNSIGLKYNGDLPLFKLKEDSKEFADKLFIKKGISEEDVVIGLNIGVGKRIFYNRKWPEKHFARLAELIEKEIGAKVVILAGPEEEEMIGNIFNESKANLINTGYDNSLEDFSAIMDKCDLIVTVDTLALHLGAALEKPIVALFGPTNKNELEIYGKGEKLSDESLKCIYCYRHTCNIAKEPVCLENLTPEIVIESIKRVLKKHPKDQ